MIFAIFESDCVASSVEFRSTKGVMTVLPKDRGDKPRRREKSMLVPKVDFKKAASFARTGNSAYESSYVYALPELR
jgi:hypothetical protein